MRNFYVDPTWERQQEETIRSIIRFARIEGIKLSLLATMNEKMTIPIEELIDRLQKKWVLILWLEPPKNTAFFMMD